MSQVRLNLQPPPNVDFVTGYPGIPPGSERPQAAVKGAIEVRVPPQGVKAKWARIELRKVETLPGGGPANTFHDFVGPSPVNLWSASDEYNLLRSQDFPFSIRIPESIPPTIQLDSRAGISYELVATVCTKGKRGFLRKAKSVVTTVAAPIIIDKHELHSTWPVYCQPDVRQLAQDGVSLIVERNRTCFGPGDRVSIVATVKSDSLNTVILRGFEIYIKEATVFRPGIHGAGKKNAPQVRQENIAETKYPINATLYGGTQHTAELSCMISPQHTTTTLNAARHIDVTYTLCIKALMGTGTHLGMDLPIIMSNWQREVSFEAISRIGVAPSLSLLPPAQSAAATMHSIQAARVDPTRGRPADAVAATLPINRGNLDSTYAHARNNSANAFTSLPGATSSAARSSNDDPYGPGYTSSRSGGLADEFGATTAAVASPANTTTSRARPGSAGGGNRLTIVNPEPSQEVPSRQRTPGSSSTASGKQWLTAEEEKLKLYEQARARVANVQGLASSPPPAGASSSPTPQTITTPLPARNTSSGSSQQNQWITAEEEKMRLFQQAQAAVQRTQAGATQPAPTHGRNNSDPNQSGSGSKPSGAALYAQAMSAQSRSASGSQAGGSSTGSQPKPAPASAPQYLTAEQEKAALRRYEEAKRAVDRTQNSGFPEETTSSSRAPNNAGPIAYDSLFPVSSSGPATPPADAPPPFDTAAGGSNIMAHLSEKERLRRAYEAQDAAALAAQQSPPPPAAYMAPPAPAPALSPPSPGQYTSALEEKEALRRKFEARDNALAAKVNNTPQPPPPRSNSGGTTAPSSPPPGSSSPSRSTGQRPTPVPPTQGPQPGSTRVLTAAEEKALLRAKYEARDGGRKPAPVSPPAPTTNGGTPTAANGATAGTPPPLMPRPPADYIKETQEEDARLSRLNGDVPGLNGTPKKLNGSSSSASLNKPPSGGSGGGGLDIKPFTPFRAGFGDIATPGPPPPLPSKAHGE